MRRHLVSCTWLLDNFALGLKELRGKIEGIDYTNFLFLSSVFFYSFHRMLQDNIRRLEYRKSQVKASLQEYTEKLTQLNHKVQVREREEEREREN